MPRAAITDPLVFDTDTDEIYHLGLVQIDVRQAKRILAAKKHKPRIQNCILDGLVRFVRRPQSRTLTDGTIEVSASPTKLDWTLIDSPAIDLTVPILLARLPMDLGGLWPIDGWHRIAKAIDSGRESLPCYILSARDSLRIITRP